MYTIRLCVFLLFISILANAQEQGNVKDLRKVSEYFDTRVWTRCEFNGILIECDALERVIQEHKLNYNRKIDPNMLKP